MKGVTHPCDTFNNFHLSQEADFDVIEMEIWGLDEDCLNILHDLQIKESLFTH